MNIKLSPSSLALFMECPRCFWLEKVKHIPRPSCVFPSLPSGVDRVLKRYFDEHRAKGTLPEGLKGKFHGRLYGDIKNLKVWRNSMRGLRFRDEETGIMLIGAIDDLFVTNNNLYAPIDFKTRGFPRNENTHKFYRLQMDLYSFLLKKNALPPADFAILIFYHPVSIGDMHENNNKCSITFCYDTVKLPTNYHEGEKIFMEAIDCLFGDEPEPSEECRWCKWVEKLTLLK